MELAGEGSPNKGGVAGWAAPGRPDGGVWLPAVGEKMGRRHSGGRGRKVRRA